MVADGYGSFRAQNELFAIERGPMASLTLRDVHSCLWRALSMEYISDKRKKKNLFHTTDKDVK